MTTKRKPRATRAVLVSSDDPIVTPASETTPMEARDREAADRLGEVWADEAIRQMRMTLSQPVRAMRKKVSAPKRRVVIRRIGESTLELVVDTKKLEEAIGQVPRRPRR